MLADSRFSLFICRFRELSLSLPIVFNIGQNGVSYRVNDPMAASVKSYGGFFHLRGGVRRITRRLLCFFTFKVCVHASVRYREALGVAIQGISSVSRVETMSDSTGAVLFVTYFGKPISP